MCVRPSSLSHTGISGIAVSHIARSKNASVAISAARRFSCGRTRQGYGRIAANSDAMQLGMVGLGRMGANMVRRVMGDGHECVVYNRSPDPVRALVDLGATGSESLADLVSKLAAPRHVWVMVPSGSATEATVQELGGLLSAGDCVIDGGNSYYKDDVRRSELLAAKGIDYLDVGTSGGIWGLERGYCLMIGGPREVAERMDPIFASLAPGRGDDRGDARAREQGRHRARTATCTAARPARGTS